MRLQLSASERSMISSYEDLESRQNILNKKIFPFYLSFVTGLPVSVNRHTHHPDATATMGSLLSG